MVDVNTIEKLERHLQTLSESCKTTHFHGTKTEKSFFQKGYAHGIKEALTIFLLHLDENKKPPYSDEIPDSSESKISVPQKLYHLSPEEINKFNFDSDNKKYTPAELVETAFRFENQLLELLGDVNTIPFDSYASLSSIQLINIIKESVTNICQINRKGTQ